MSYRLQYDGPTIDDILERANTGGAIDQSITDAIDAEEARADGAYMKKGIDYVTAGQRSGTTPALKATAEGYNVTASGRYSHAGGEETVASGRDSTAIGYKTTASGDYSFATGNNSQATGYMSQAHGLYSIANHYAQTVFGKYNEEDPSTAAPQARGNYVEIVGNGETINSRSNARTLDWEGNETLAGKLTIGADPVDDMDVVPKKMLDAVSITDTASGSIASFSDGADGVAMRSVKVAVTPVQSGSGDPSPDNVRPISGWTGAEINRTGINLWDGEYESGGYNQTTGEKMVNTTINRNAEPIPVSPNTTYYLRNVITRIFEYDANGGYIGTSVVQGNSAFTTSSITHFTNFQCNNTADMASISVNYPSSDHDYHAYAGQTFPVTWETQAGTVYGGTIDVVSGDLTVTHKAVAPTAITSAALDGVLAQISISNAPAPTSAATAVTGIASSHLVTVSQSTLLNSATLTGVALSPTGANIQFKIEGVSGKTAFDEWCAANNPQFVYPLAQPVTYRLSAQQITSLLRQNNVWSNTGDVEVEYVADPTKYIDKRITELFAALSH